MIENLRPLLYYPLGLLPPIFFTLRVLIQWIQSERHRRSYVGRTFWRLSLAGNLLLILHYFVQVQFPFALLQVGNAVISWRNLNLMNSKNPCSTKRTVAVLLASFALMTVAFLAQSHYIIGKVDWIRTPTKVFDAATLHHSLGWHILGTIGVALFSFRFWIQWWQAETSKRSVLSKNFWWFSIIGSVIALVYFVRIHDNVSILTYGCGLIPYFRNLFLMKQKPVT
ncbi:MAG: hypothetical protein K940chlam7_00220 [Chlamydiae bacterium]|nr:hypothetical protein [Chlamydiota bacterium]